MAEEKKGWCDSQMAKRLNELQNRMRSARATGVGMSSDDFNSQLMDILCDTRYHAERQENRPGSELSRDDRGRQAEEGREENDE